MLNLLIAMMNRRVDRYYTGMEKGSGDRYFLQLNIARQLPYLEALHSTPPPFSLLSMPRLLCVALCGGGDDDDGDGDTKLDGKAKGKEKRLPSLRAACQHFDRREREQAERSDDARLTRVELELKKLTQAMIDMRRADKSYADGRRVSRPDNASPEGKRLSRDSPRSSEGRTSFDRAATDSRISFNRREPMGLGLVKRNSLVVEEGETASLFRAPQHDYTQRLLASTPGRAWSEQAVPAIPG